MACSERHRPVLSRGQRGGQEGEKLSESDELTIEKGSMYQVPEAGRERYGEGSFLHDHERSVVPSADCALLNGVHHRYEVVETIERSSDDGIAGEKVTIHHTKVFDHNCDAVDFDAQ
jgi:hypothetical protein